MAASGDKGAPRAAAPERIARRIARAGLCSRRDAEKLIAEGRVTINGETVTSPARNVTAADTVAVDGAPLPAPERTRLFRYHKPKGRLTTARDPEGRPTIFDDLPQGLPRLVTVGRLDFNTEGLLLLTNDGALARALELPATGWLRRYRVRAHGRVDEAVLEKLGRGVTVDGVDYGPVEARIERLQGSNLWLVIGIREGKNREVRRILEHLGLTVNRLIRVSFGSFHLGSLPPGDIAEVPRKTLLEQAGRLLPDDGTETVSRKGHARAKPRPNRPGRRTPPRKRGREKDDPHAHRRRTP